MKWKTLLSSLIAASFCLFLPVSSLRADVNPPPDVPITDHTPTGFVKYAFDASKLEAAFGDKLALYTNITICFGFLMLVIPSATGLIKHGLSPETMSRCVIKPIMLCAFIAIVPDMKTALTDGMNDLGTAAGYNGLDLVSKYYTETSVFNFEQTTNDIKSSSAADDGFFKKITEFTSFMQNALHWLIQHLISVPFAILLALLGLVTEMGILIGDFVRTVLLDVGYALLPLFIAGLNFGPFQGPGMNYIKRMICLHMWPLAWSLVGLVTVTMVHLLHIYVNDIFTTAMNGGGNATMTALSLFGAWELVPIGTLLVIVGVMCIATCWQIYGLYKAPKMMSDFVINGSLAFEGWFPHVLQSAAKAFAGVAVAAVAIPLAPIAGGAVLGGAAGGAAAGGAAAGGAAAGGGAMASMSFGQTLGTGAKLMGRAVTSAMTESFRRASQS